MDFHRLLSAFHVSANMDSGMELNIPINRNRVSTGVGVRTKFLRSPSGCRIRLVAKHQCILQSQSKWVTVNVAFSEVPETVKAASKICAQVAIAAALLVSVHNT